MIKLSDTCYVKSVESVHVARIDAYSAHIVVNGNVLVEAVSDFDAGRRVRALVDRYCKKEESL